MKYEIIDVEETSRQTERLQCLMQRVNQDRRHLRIGDLLASIHSDLSNEDTSIQSVDEETEIH